MKYGYIYELNMENGNCMIAIDNRGFQMKSDTIHSHVENLISHYLIII